MPNNNSIHDIFKFLTTDPLTNQVSKKFFDGYVLPTFAESKKNPVSVRLFDLAHLKLSNDVIGHNQTDEKINELYTKIVSQIEEENSFSKYFASAGNCGLLLIENADSAIPDNKINEFVSNALINQRILDITTSTCVCEPEEILQTFFKLEKDCSVKKEEKKLNRIKRKQTILPLQLALKDSMQIYIKNNHNPYSITSKQYLIAKIFDTLTQVIKEQFPNQDPTIFNRNVWDSER